MTWWTVSVLYKDGTLRDVGGLLGGQKGVTRRSW